MKMPLIAAGDYVLVRTFSAGVHVGVFMSRRGKEVWLTSARRVWSWAGANSCSELANNGLDVTQSKVCEPVKAQLVTEAIEVIACTPKAKKCFESAKWT
jgi:hypothetical protein